MKKVFLEGIIIFLLIAITGLGITTMDNYNKVNETEIWAEALEQSYEQAKKEYEEKVQKLDSEIEQTKEQYYLEKLTKVLSKDRLIGIAKEQWDYSLKVNNVSFTSDHIYPVSNDVTILISEKQAEEKILPMEIHEWGSLTSGDEMDKFFDHLMIESVVPWETSVEEKENSTNVFYSFKDIPKGTIITLRISEPLRERLDLEFSELEVFVK